MSFSFLCEFEKFREPHSVEITEILSHRKNISWNQVFSNFFSKDVDFTKFLLRKCEREFSYFPHCETASDVVHILLVTNHEGKNKIIAP